MKLNKEQVLDLTEGDDVVDQSSTPSKYGTTETYVFKLENKYWRFSFQATRNEGWELDNGVVAVEVKPESKVITVWVPA